MCFTKAFNSNEENKKSVVMLFPFQLQKFGFVQKGLDASKNTTHNYWIFKLN